MKKLKIGFFKRYNSFLGVLLALLGFSAACEQLADEYGTAPVEYGVPTATFVVKGTIQSQDNSTAIPHIRVIMGYDTAFSDQNGNYQVEDQNFPSEQSFLVEFKDVDGTANGEYNASDSTVEFKDPVFTGGSGNWDSGKTEKELNIKLEPKK